ncbi:Crp/Fnr family transcriptional regulator [Colwellia psychrerythraea]|uniref:Cyclic nucleotide binding protein n=1 Tax=Colwellia psychrerythraea (strain 34H / ATCC BAA-681) TaxID=167879 RepID=Q483F5_COLP3|nr:Crp/Fnr family transcriptional regulator [Colwellia psychrerythraea]AAZ27571.1 cyclic nucleotide binding protein [Colwellia psychrerythraea 34H]
MLVIPDLHNWRKNLPPIALEEIQQTLTLKSYKTNEFIYSAGDDSNKCFQVVSGEIKVCNYSLEGNELIISSLHANDCFGEMGLITGQKRINYAIAIKDVTVNVINSSDFDTICLKHPQILMSLNKFLCNRLQMAFEMMEDAYLLPLYQRLAKLLIKLALSNGESNPDGHIIIKNVSQESLGLMIGATRQSISRELKKMEEEGMISFKYTQLIIPNIKEMINQFENILTHEPLVSSYSK